MPFHLEISSNKLFSSSPSIYNTFLILLAPLLSPLASFLLALSDAAALVTAAPVVLHPAAAASDDAVDCSSPSSMEEEAANCSEEVLWSSSTLRLVPSLPTLFWLLPELVLLLLPGLELPDVVVADAAVEGVVDSASAMLLVFVDFSALVLVVDAVGFLAPLPLLSPPPPPLFALALSRRVKKPLARPTGLFALRRER